MYIRRDVDVKQNIMSNNTCVQWVNTDESLALGISAVAFMSMTIVALGLNCMCCCWFRVKRKPMETSDWVYWIFVSLTALIGLVLFSVYFARGECETWTIMNLPDPCETRSYSSTMNACNASSRVLIVGILFFVFVLSAAFIATLVLFCTNEKMKVKSYLEEEGSIWLKSVLNVQENENSDEEIEKKEPKKKNRNSCPPPCVVA